MIRKVKKGQILQFRGDVNTKVYVVKKGLLRSYSIDKKGKEHIFMFAPEGWIIADNYAPEDPCELFIDAIEDSEVSILPKDHKNEKDALKLIKRIRVLQNRIIMLMSSTALERYEDFVSTYPEILARVPQKMIASYLGVAPETLSSIKRNK